MKLLLQIIFVFILIITILKLLKKTELFYSKKKNILLINNNFKNGRHLEIIESLIFKNNEIIKKNINFDNIYIHNPTYDTSFINYIENKYPKVLFIKDRNNIKYDYYINATIYPDPTGLDKYTENPFKHKVKSLPLKDLTKKNHYFISHKIDKRFDNTNTFYLTPLCNTNKYIMADILPFTENKKQMSYPVFLIIGRSTLRNNNILENILKKYDNYDKKFLIKYMTRKSPNFKKKYKNLKICVDYNFIDFHKEISDCYCMLMLISKKNQPNYFKIQLTSSINYILAYKMKAIIDKELKDIYNLNDSDCYIYNEKNILNQFENVINDFYS